MNKIFKVIWSTATNSFIVVSELASSKGKGKSITQDSPQVVRTDSTIIPFKLNKVALLSLLSLSVLPFYSVAADVTADNLTVTGDATIAGALTVDGKNVKDALDALESGKADQVEVTTLSGKVTNLETNKADKSVVNTLSGKVTNLETNKADKSAVNTLSGKVTNLENNKADKTDVTNLDQKVSTLGDALGINVAAYDGIKYFRANSTVADAKAVGADSIAIGALSESKGDKALAVGFESDSRANSSVAIGDKAKTQKSADYGVAIGKHARVGTSPLGDIAYDGADSVVVGDGDSSIAIGKEATGRGNRNIAIGQNSLTANKDADSQFTNDSIAFGTDAKVIASDYAIAMGHKSIVGKNSDHSIAIGDIAKTSAKKAIALGTNAQGTEIDAIAIGSDAVGAGVSSVAIGKNALANSGSNIAIGDQAKALPFKTISIGLNAGKGQAADKTGTKHSHINIGENAGENVDGQLNIGIGQSAGKDVKGKANIAIGVLAGQGIGATNDAFGENVSIGNKANSYGPSTALIKSTSVGSQSKAGDQSSAYGYNAQSGGRGSVAIGFDALVSDDKGVAIGFSTKADGNNVALGGSSLAKTKAGSGYVTGMTSQQVVSVGNENLNLYRRLVNVADGVDKQDAVTVAQLEKTTIEISAKLQKAYDLAQGGSGGDGIKYDTVTSTTNGAAKSITLVENTRIANVSDAEKDTDAVNLRQLNNVVNENMNHYFSTNDGGTHTGNYDNTSATGLDSMAIGQSTIAIAERSLAIGNKASAYGTGSIAIGTEYIGSAALDDGIAKSSDTNASKANQDYKYALAMGAGANSEGNNSIAIGSLAATTNKDISGGNVDRAIAIGYYAKSSGEKANAIGDRSVANAPKGNAIGSESFSGAESSNAIGTKTVATGINSIAIGTNEEVSGANSGSIGYAGQKGAENQTKVSGEGTYSVGNTNGKLTGSESAILGNSNKLNADTNVHIDGNENSIGSGAEPTASGAAPINKLKDIYVTGYKNKISDGKKYAEDLSGLFVSGHNNIIADIADADSTDKIKITDSAVIGANNTLNTSGDAFFVLGNNVTATQDNSVYLGDGAAYIAETEKDAAGQPISAAMTKYDNRTDNFSGYKFAGSQPVGVVTVGSHGEERRIQNVAAGLVEKSSTDAINGSQLFALTRPLRFGGDNSTVTNQDGKPATDVNVIARSSNQAIDITGGENDASKLTAKADKNIGVIVTDTNSMEVRLAKNLTALDSATFGTGANTTVINNEGMTINKAGKDPVSVTTAGLDNGNNQIKNVASGGDIDTNGANIADIKNRVKDSEQQYKGDNGVLVKRKPADVLTIKGGATEGTENNIRTESNVDGSVAIKLAKNVSGLGSVSIGTGDTQIVLDNKGVSVAGNTYVSKDGLNANNKQITNVQSGGDVDTNAANIGDIKTKIADTEQQYTGDNGTVIVKRNPSQVLKLEGGAVTETDNNIKTVADASGKVVIKLAQKVSLGTDGELTTGNTLINNDGITIKGGSNNVTLTNKGLNNGGNQIVKVDSGLKDATGNAIALKDATGDMLTNGVNVGDLQKSINDVTIAGTTGGFGLKDKAGAEFKQDLGTTAQITGDDNINTKVVDVTDPVTGKVTKALEVSLANDITVGGPNKDGTPGKDGTIGAKGADGTTGVVLNGKDGTIGINGKDGKATIGINGKNGAAGVDGTVITRIEYTDPDTGNKETVATLNDGLKFGANDGTVHNAKLNTQVDIKGAAANTTWADFDAGQNIMTQINGNTVTVALAKKLAGLTSATFGDTAGDQTVLNKDGVTISGKTGKDDVKLTEDGLDNGGNQIVNVDSGLKDATGNAVDLKDATGDVLINGVNVGDLKNAVTDITADGFGLKDKAGNEFKQDLGTTAQITGDDNINTKVVDVTDPVTGKVTKALEVSLANDITVGGPNKDGTPGKDGTIGAKGADGSTGVVLNGKDGTIGINGKDGKATIGINGKNGAAGVDGTAITRIEYTDPDTGNKETVATLNDGLKFGANDGTVHNAKLNTQVDIKGAAANTDWTKFDEGKNIMTQIKDNTVTVALAKDLAGLDSATFGDGTDKTVINKDGITITEGGKTVSLTESGLDNGGNKITNVAAGTDATDAVNVSQLEAGLAKATTKVTAGDNIEVTSTTNPDGSTSYEVKTKKDVNFDSVTTGDTVMNNDGVKVGDNVALTKDGLTAGDTTVDTNGVKVGDDVALTKDGLTIEGGPSVTKAGIDAGGKKITGVADGDISPTSSDAVNGSQLHAVKELAAAGWNLTANGNDISNVAPNATVDLNNKDGNIEITKSGNNVTFGLAKDLNVEGSVIVGPKGTDGKPGEGAVAIDGKDGISIAGKDGKDAVSINGKDGIGTIGLTGPVGADGKNAQATIGVKDGVKGLDGNDGKNGESKTRIIYKKPDGTEEQVATMNDGLIFAGDSGEHKAKLGTTVNVKGDGKNITTEVTGDTLRVKLNDNISVKGATISNSLVVKKGAKIDMGNNVVTNVADGRVAADSKDAVNGSQLYKVQSQINNNIGAINHLGDRINKVDKDLRAGIAGATATAGLPQAYIPGKSMVAIAGGTYQGQNAVALGVSRISDNGKIVIKLSGNADSRGKFGATIGAGYQW